MADENDKVTVIKTDSGGGGGGILAVILLIIVLAVLVFVFRDQLGLGEQKTEINIPNQIDVNIN